jgi:hypothetical protein
VSSISSPPATLLSTSEKLREASVAVIRVTTEGYQINLIATARSGASHGRSHSRADASSSQIRRTATMSFAYVRRHSTLVVVR